ncbi:MAG: transposase [Culicoidibacterales bacterium]
MTKTEMKVLGCFRSELSMENFFIIRSLIQTAKKNKQNYYEVFKNHSHKTSYWSQELDVLVLFLLTSCNVFIYEEVQNAYSKTMGRPAESPIMMFKYILLKSKYKVSDRDLIARTKTDMLFKYFLGYTPEDVSFINPSSLSKFRRMRLADTNLLDVLIQKTVDLAKNENIIPMKTRLIMDSTHTNAMFQHVSPREELINRGKALRKAVYEVDDTMKEKMPRKREATGLLEDQITYSKELIEKVKASVLCMNIESVKERLHYLEEGIEDTEIEVEYSKEPGARVGHKTADTSFFGFNTHIAMTPERIITAATITSGEKHDGKELQRLVEKTKASGLEIEAVIGDGA